MVLSPEMEYLIRLVQVHESFRRPELEALAILADVNVEFLFYSEYVCFLILLRSLPFAFALNFLTLSPSDLSSHHTALSSFRTRLPREVSSAEAF